MRQGTSNYQSVLSQLIGAVAGRGIFYAVSMASILLVLCLLGSIQLFVLGVIGQYIGRIYEETLARPLYIASELCGVDRPDRPRHRAVFSSGVVTKPAGVRVSHSDEVDLRALSADIHFD